MRNILLSVLTTVALVSVTVGPTAALQEASDLSTGYLTIVGVTSTVDIGPRRQQDRGFGVFAQAFDVQKQRRDRMAECQGGDSTRFTHCQQIINCYTSADLQFKRGVKRIESCIFDGNNRVIGGDADYCNDHVLVSDLPDLEGELGTAHVLCDKTYPDPSG